VCVDIWLTSSTLERRICLERRHRDYSISMRRRVKLLNHGWILPTKSPGSTGTDGLAINGTVPVTRDSGNGRYARAYLDFFEDEVVRSNYDWKRVVLRYVVEGDEPLLSGLISGGMDTLSVFILFRRRDEQTESDCSLSSINPSRLRLRTKQRRSRH